eukprot:8955291-Pyramimonas_sp.AAC.1
MRSRRTGPVRTGRGAGWRSLAARPRSPSSRPWPSCGCPRDCHRRWGRRQLQSWRGSVESHAEQRPPRVGPPTPSRKCRA